MLRNYQPGDARGLLALWNTAGAQMGYAPLEEQKLRKLLTEHPDFSPRFSFVLEEDNCLVGFINGCAGAHIAGGEPWGYISCLILAPQADSEANTRLLLGSLEQAFREAGLTRSLVSYFNPIRLPWVMPGTGGHQHNNVPGVPVDLPLHQRMLDLGYQESDREIGLHYDLANHVTPEWVEAKAAKMAARGYTVARYDATIHTGLDEMVAALNNTMWSAEIPAAGRAGMDLLVALKDNVCAGFTGPCYPEETGRGYLAGVAVAPQYEGNGLGTLLFYRLLQRDKEVGAKYMSIFTGIDNHAKFIYFNAGFQIVRTFALVHKDL